MEKYFIVINIISLFLLFFILISNFFDFNFIRFSACILGIINSLYALFFIEDE